MKFKKVEKGVYKGEGENVWVVKCKRYNNWNVYRGEDQPTGWPSFDVDLDFIAFAETKAAAIAEIQ